MPTLKETRESLETISIFGTISNIYEGIAQLRMNRIRGEALKTRQFLEGLARVYSLAKKSYLTFSPQKNKKKAAKFLTQKKKGTLTVYLSSNDFLSGPLIMELWQSIKKYLNENKAHLAIIGKMGKYLAESEGYGDKFFYFQLDDEKPGQRDIEELMEFIQEYEKIIVFHGRFETVIYQKSAQTDISGGVYLKEKTAETVNYLFEPSPEKVLELFENEIVVALFNQVILEHRLARYAARLISMHQISEKAGQMEEKLKKDEKKIRRQLSDKEQIEFFGSFNLWKQKTTT